MKATFKDVAPYAEDAMNLPVANVDDAIPFYEQTMGFVVLSRKAAPVKSVVLGRDQIQIGLAENGGDPTQEGCFFEVDNLSAAFQEVKGKEPSAADFRLDSFGDKSYLVFFVIAPDGLCYMLGESQN